MPVVTVRDTTGRKHAIARELNAPGLSEEERGALDRARNPLWLRWIGRVAAIGIVPFIVSVFVFGDSDTTSPVVELLAAVFGFPFIVGLPLYTLAVILRGVSGTRARAIARAWAHMGRCIWCGYSLGEVPTSDEGIKVCPECGGRWRMATTRR